MLIYIDEGGKKAYSSMIDVFKCYAETHGYFLRLLG